MARLAGAVALAGLVAACSSSADRFGPITGSTGNASTASNDSVYSSPVPPANSGGNTYASAGQPSSNVQSGASYSSGGPSGGYQANSGTSGQSYSNTASAAGQGSRTVVVSQGQTLYSIARENGVSVQDVVAANGLAPPYHLKAGQRISIPSGSGGGTRYAANTSAGQQVRAEATNASAKAGQSLSASGGTHTVRPGETLYSLGRSYSVSPGEIASLNGFGMSHQLKVGEKVRIPGAGSTNLASKDTGKAGTANKVASASQTATDASVGTSGKGDRVTGATSTQGNAASSSTSSGKSASLPSPEARTSSNFRWPVKGRVISQYGPKANGSRNDGINISVPAGTSVRAAENGVVAYAGNELKGYGNLVLIRHSDGWVTAYAHNEELLVSRGDMVKRGDIIAKAGQSGSVTSPQLHFEIRKGAQAVDPMQHLGSANLAGN
ncbi:LysM peptidoglycan-binding domain-containing M23 family metallopeptidase [Kaustia mangrovi]|uniref:LysM peptidoglycan-binding domain-containing M23 family metallopeptidase n=1 Tax=Kaustia mangrovi TaxID=2593653 RepID=A0A7S8C1J3_9HYPH|nr:LysM peptidoglycan-binding domain-containing M23 family metallopeptidase [Kaustia mangrovi]QPC41675.1 LysM peptidoglycan-binding domain-containing M23 family metallopeptidase [Kaustia mangrovi]